MCNRTTIALFYALFLSACVTQLPPRQDGIKIDDVPNLDSSLIPSNNGLLSAGLSSVPGSYCFTGDDGKCDPAKLSPAQCLVKGSTVEVAPSTNPTPSFDALIDHKYAGTANVPFVSATASAEYYDEVKATVAGTAMISQASTNNGYPGVDGLKACILHNEGPGTYGTVYWISKANIYTVTLQHFKQVASTDGITATAFGLNGSTYDHIGQTEEKIWIGLQASPVVIGKIDPIPTKSKGTHKLIAPAYFDEGLKASQSKSEVLNCCKDASDAQQPALEPQPPLTTSSFISR